MVHQGDQPMYKRALLVLVSALALFGGHASAAAIRDLTSTVEIAIPAQPLASALLEFSAQTGMQVVTAGADVRDLKTAGISGRVTVGEALKKLLAGSGLSFKLMGENTVGLTRATAEVSREIPLRLAQSPTEEGANASAQSPNQDEISEIIVTAQKRAERMIEVPQSVSVLSAEALNKLGATQFRDFANTVPGLNFQTAGVGFNQLSLRGVTTGYDITPSVGNVVDDVPYGSSSAFARGAQLALDVGLFDIDRVEVLRGPQGTLYGASTMGGLIKYVTKTPDATRLASELRTGVSDTTDGSLNYFGSVAVNFPLIADKAALRMSGFYSKDGGYVDNVALNQEDINASAVKGGKLDLSLAPTDALDVRLTAVLQDITRDGSATSDHTVAGAPVYGELTQFRLIPETFDQRFRLASATINYDIGAANLTSISSYQTIRSHFIVDDSPLLLPVLQLFFGRTYSAAEIDNGVDTDKFTQEIRLASDGARPIEWLIGGFYTHEISENRQALLLLDAARQPSPNDLFLYRTPSKYKEYAAFGNLTYYFSDKFDVTGGMRYARNEQTYTQDASGLLIGSVPKREDEANVYTYLANARYRFTPNSTAYARFAAGYRPGGPNAVSLDPLTGQPNAPATFKADTSKSYELGYKIQSASGRFGADLATYHIDWSDLQQLTTTPSGVSYYANANAGAEINGAELTLNFRPISSFTATGAFAFQDATMSDAEPILGARKGERLPNVPRFTAALSADYVFPAANFNPSVGMTFRSVSDRLSSFDANTTVAQYDLGSYSTFDLRAGFVIGAAEIQLYLRNVGDERGQLVIPSGVSSPAGPISVSTLQPRTIGFNATMSF